MGGGDSRRTYKQYARLPFRVVHAPGTSQATAFRRVLRARHDDCPEALFARVDALPAPAVAGHAVMFCEEEAQFEFPLLAHARHLKHFLSRLQNRVSF